MSKQQKNFRSLP